MGGGPDRIERGEIGVRYEVDRRPSFGAHNLRGGQRCRSGKAGLHEFTSVHRRSGIHAKVPRETPSAGAPPETGFGTQPEPDSPPATAHFASSAARRPPQFYHSP